MKKILIASDFSSNADSAIEYGLKLAQVFNAKVYLFNSFVTVPAIGIDGGPGVMSETVIHAGIESHREKMESILSDLSEDLTKGLHIEIVIGDGDPVINICEYAKDQAIDLVLMGTKGESRLEEILFGSTTVEVMKECRCPVIAIPHNSTFYGIKKIVYASDLEEKDIAVIEHLCSFAKFFDSDVVVFHVFEEDNMTNQEEADEFNDLLVQRVKYPKLKKESVTYGNTHDAILDVVKKDLANLIVMREKDRGIFGRLFHKDMVKRINFHTTIPLMVYNDRSL
ncbi:MAG: universal stress protein [Vicingaceae bacterium]